MTENELLDELAQELVLPLIEPDEVTAKMLATKLGTSERGALDQLHKKETAGILTSRWVRGRTGRRVLAFRKAT